MNEIAVRDAPTRDIWQSIPLELAMSVLAILLAGGLKILGWMP